MKMNSMKKWLSLLLCVMLIAAMALCVTGCKDHQTAETPNTPSTQASGENVPQATVAGEGATVFTFVVVDKESKETRYEIHTDEKTVGAALLTLKLIDGEAGEYGLYIKSVLGQTLDWDKDGMYWGFYVNDEYALTGVDMTDIVSGSVYKLQADKG